MKSDRATLGIVPGTGYVEFRSASGLLKELSGLFAYASQDEEEVSELFWQGKV